MNVTKRIDDHKVEPAPAYDPKHLMSTARSAATSLVEKLQALQQVRAADLPSLWAEHIAAVQEVVQFLDSDAAPLHDSRRRLPMTLKQRREFGRLLRDCRSAAGLSRLQLARKAQLSDATLKFIETARNPPSRASLIRLINVPALRLRWEDVPGQPALRAAVGNPLAPNGSGSAADGAFVVLDRLDFDELGDPVFVRRLVGPLPELPGALAHPVDFVPMRR